MLRTQEGYKSNIKHPQNDPGMTPAYGIKPNSCQTELEFFHVAENLPPDLTHDSLEVFVFDFMSGIIGVLVEQKYFTLQELNNRISTFKYARIDKTNKRQPLKIISSVSFKVKETAYEMWYLIKLFPVIIGDQLISYSTYLLS